MYYSAISPLLAIRTEVSGLNTGVFAPAAEVFLRTAAAPLALNMKANPCGRLKPERADIEKLQE